MKKILLLPLIFVSFYSLSQNNTNPYPTAGNLGIGTTSANFNLQVHGTTDFNVNVPAIPPMYDMFGNIVVPGSPGYTLNHGRTARLGLTNTTTGLTNNDGLLIRMSGLNGVIENLENQNITIASSGATMTFSGSNNRIWFSRLSPTPTATSHAYMNIITDDNGLFIKSHTAGKYGISIQPKNDVDNAIQVIGTNGTTRNFSVQSNGNVHARKYITTLSNIPDYVFSKDYNLMSFSELRTFINKNSHLPNVPSAAEYEKTGVDLGEMNRVLLEKVEELTLYILQLEERMNQLEEQKK